MNKKKAKKILILQAQLTTAIFLLVVVLISGFFIFGPNLTEVVQALNPADYNKPADGQLTAADWNRLDADFVAKSGDAMAGPLTLPGNPTLPNHAANKQYADSTFVDTAGDTMTGFLTLSGDPASNLQAATKQYVDDNLPITDAFGNVYKMYCASSPAGGWSTYGVNSVMTVVNTSAAGFSNVWRYTVSLSGTNAGPAMGQNTLYNISNTSFELHILYAGWAGDFPGITGTDANTWGWQVHWCGIGN